MAIATPIGATIAEFQGHFQLALIARWQGEYEEALAHLNQVDRISQSLPGPGFRLLPLSVLGGLYLDISEELAGKSLAYQAEALNILNARAVGFGSLAWEEIALCKLITGDLDLADEYLQNGLAARDSLMYFIRPSLLVGQALLALVRNELPEAIERIAEARSFVEERGMQSYTPLIALAEGRINAAAGRREYALEQFARAESLAREMGMLPTVWKAQVAADRELSADGRTVEAEEKRREATVVIEKIAGKIVDEELRDAFLHRAKGIANSQRPS